MATPQPSEHDLNAFGDMMAASAFGGPALGLTLLGMQIFMVFYGISSFLSTPKRKRQGRLRFVIISCTILITSSISIALDAWGGYRVLYRGGPDGKSYIQSNTEIWGTSQVSTLIGDAAGWVTIVQGDALMLWRCFVLWRHRKWLVLLPFFAFLSGTVSIIISLLPIASWQRNYLSPERVKPIVAGISMSVAANIMVTTLIVCRLVTSWSARRKYFPDQEGPNIYASVIGIMVESAAPLALTGIGLVISLSLVRFHPTLGFLERGKATAAADFFSWLYTNGFTALSPQMIIFRVTTGTSWKNSSESNEGVSTFSKPMGFASAPNVTSTESKSSASTYVV